MTDTIGTPEDRSADGLAVRRHTLPDGRYLLLYDEAGAATGGATPVLPGVEGANRGPARSDRASQLRRDPALDEWVIVAPHRQDRTYHPPAELCPLCPTRPGGTATEVPVEAFDIAVFENRFPGLPRLEPGPPPGPVLDARKPDLFACATGRGQAEVVVYTSEHDGSLGGLGVDRIDRVLRVWSHRYRELSRRPEIRNVFIFENRGEAVGVTLDHPHGQVYGHPLVPPIPARMLEVEAAHHRRTGRCLRCDIVSGELDGRDRLVRADDRTVAHVPFAPRWPYEVHIVLRPHRRSLPELSTAERRDLAASLQAVLRGYDRLFHRAMPYILSVMQAPTATSGGPGSHLRIEVYPALRTARKLKYRAASETAMGITVTDMLPEAAAARLRDAVA